MEVKSTQKAGTVAIEEFLLTHSLISENRLNHLKQEAETTNQPLSTVLSAHGLLDDVQSKWEEVFRTSAWAKYPSEEMIRFVARTYQKAPNRRDVHFLDLGCGIGTSAWYLAKEGYTVTGLDGSPSAIDVARQWFTMEKLDATFQIGLMQNLPYEDGQFDCVIDNVSSPSTPLPVLRTILNEVKRVLKPGGWYYGLFLGDESTIDGIQNPDSDDPKFYEKITAGPIQRAATVRLVNKEEIHDLFHDAKELKVDYALRTVNNCSEKVQYWIVNALWK